MNPNRSVASRAGRLIFIQAAPHRIYSNRRLAPAHRDVIRKRMKLDFVAAAILGVGCVWWGSNVSYAEQLSLHEWGQIVGPDPLACRSHNDWKKMTALMADDAAAAMEFGHKYCKMIEEMTIVSVENVYSDALYVRPMGGYDCFWILPQWAHGLDDD